jgi:hypothetical protein
MKKVTLLLITLLALGLSSCDKVIGQDNKQTTITQIVPSITAFTLANEANASQTENFWQPISDRVIEIYNCQEGELVKVGSAVVYLDNTYTIFKYNEYCQLEPLFNMAYKSRFRPQNN